MDKNQKLNWVTGFWVQNKSMEKEIVTRKELYDLVWSVPLQTLSKKQAIAGVGRGKICVKNGNNFTQGRPSPLGTCSSYCSGIVRYRHYLLFIRYSVG
jgi:hypothetical protein